MIKATVYEAKTNLSNLVERAARGDVEAALAILDRAGLGNPPMKGDELPTR